MGSEGSVPPKGPDAGGAGEDEVAGAMAGQARSLSTLATPSGTSAEVEAPVSDKRKGSKSCQKEGKTASKLGKNPTLEEFHERYRCFLALT